jgi:hypothetical protein
MAAAVVLILLAGEPFGQALGPPVDLHHALDRRVVAGVAVPDGFEWWSIDEISVAVRKPNEWRTSPRQVTLSGWTYAARPADGLGERSSAELSIQVYWHPDGRKGPRPAQEVFRAVVNPIATDASCAILESGSSPGSMPDIVNFRMHYRKSAPGRPPLLVRKLFVSDEVNGLLYVATFQAEEQEWNSVWNMGRVMLERVLIGFKRVEPTR